METHEIVGEIYKVRTRLEKYTELLDEMANQKAKAISHYSHILGEAIKSYRDGGYGVNLCESIAKGDKEVKEALYYAEKAESLYYVGLEKVRSARADLDILKTLLLTQRDMAKGE